MKKNFFAGITMLAIFITALIIVAPPPAAATFYKKAVGIEKAMPVATEYFVDTSPGIIVYEDAGFIKDSPNETIDNDAGSYTVLISIAQIGAVLKNGRYGTARDKLDAIVASNSNNNSKTAHAKNQALKDDIPSPDISSYGNLGKDAIPKQTEISISNTLGKGGINEVLLE